MKKLIFLIAFVFAALTLSAQGTYLTKSIKNGISNLEQPPYAALSFADSTVTQALTADIWSVISEFTTSASNDVTGSDDTITITLPGTGGYAINADLNYYTGSGDTIEVSLFKNATAIGPKMTTTGGATHETISLSHYVSLTQGDVVTLRMQNITDSTDGTVKSGSIFIRRIYKY